MSSSKKGDCVIVDLFSGPGGLSLGFEQAGFTIAIGVEADRWSAITYRTNFPNSTVIEKNVRNLAGNEILELIDRKFANGRTLVLISGPPCQPFSNANMHMANKGGDHKSFSAVSNFARLVQETQPDAFLFENVTTFETMDKSRSMKKLLKTIHTLGYNPSLTRLEAHRYGVPQHRRRLFIGGVKNTSDFQLPKSDPPYRSASVKHKDSPRLVYVEDAIKNLPKLPRGGGGTQLMSYSRNRTLEAGSYQRGLERGAPYLYNHWSTRHSDRVVKTIKYIKPGSSLVKGWSMLPRSIKKRYGNRPNIQENIYRRLRWRGLSPTIVHPRRAMLLHPSQNRILSVREAARIQGFPDTFVFQGGIDSQYQQVANAVPPPLARVLGRWYLRYLQRQPNVREPDIHIDSENRSSDYTDIAIPAGLSLS